MKKWYSWSYKLQEGNMWHGCSAHGFVKPKMVSKWKITIKGGLGEVFESSSLVCKTGARRSLSESKSEQVYCNLPNLRIHCVGFGVWNFFSGRVSLR